jgi:DNA mismatch repair protein MutS
MSKKVSIYDTYFADQDKYSKIYGDKTIVFYQIGKFYESYCTKDRGYTKLEELEPLLNIKFIRRDNTNKEDNKPNQFGINCVAISKNLSILMEHGYTIVLFDQKTNNDEDIERVCSGIFSPGTYLSEKQIHDTNYLMCAYLVDEKQFTNKTLMAIGLTLIDISTGNIMVHEFYGNKLDERFGLDELIRIMQMFRPTELIFYYYPIRINENTIKSIRQYLELDRYQNCHFYIYDGKTGNDRLNLLTVDSFKISYQNDYLAEIFDLPHQLIPNGVKSAIEILKMDRLVYATISLLITLKYIKEHNPLLIKNLSFPDIYLYNKHLILGNNAIEQLNIVDSNGLQVYNHRFQSLFDVVNRTATPMGRRFLKGNLLNPLSQESKRTIIRRYNMIDAILENKLYKKIHSELKNIYDIERLHRKMAIGVIVPYEFYRLDLFYQSATKIIFIIKDVKVLKEILPEKIIKDFLSYQIMYNKVYELEKLQNYQNFNEIDNSFFKKGVHTDIDRIQDKIDYVKSMINSTSKYLSELVSSKCTKNKNRNILETESNEREGYYFTISKTNEKILRHELSKKTKIKISLSVGENLEINNNDIVFKQLPKGRTKIFVTPLINHTIKLEKQTEKLSKLIKRKFVESMISYYTNNKEILHRISQFVAEIDFLVSGAIVAKEYYYCKPIIPSDKNVPSYLVAKELRHAIVERLCNETEYIPNDIELGNVPSKDNENISMVNNESHNLGYYSEEIKKNGVVLFGLNSSGKTCFMKSIGIAIILAQIGYYVPAKEFIYEPYMALYARITGNDNIFKGLSSFTLEMTELDAILIRVQSQGPNTLVIGDEVCRGTEDISGLSIVASALITLSECKSTFIFSSHLHKLPELDEIKKLDNLRLYHLKVKYNKNNDCLIFNRKLEHGPGPSVYGLTVAKYLIKNKKFIDRAESIKRKLLDGNIDILTKKSNYNRNLPIKRCFICRYFPRSDKDKELESHHIIFQKDCMDDGKIRSKPYLTKNKLYNLVILCHKCHTKVHHGKIIIRGYLDTSLGPLLDYTINNKKILQDEITRL